MFKKSVFLMSLLVAVYGCGSGGGSSTDTTPPTVSSVSPANGATGVALSATISATFSEEMEESTVTTSTFAISTGGNNINGTISHSGNTYTFTPSTSLTSNTQYTATITTGVKDSAGNALASNYTWSFTTGATDTPTVSSTSPISGATGIVNSIISATFSKTMDSSTVTTSTFTISPAGGGNISGTISNSGNTYTFTPSTNLSSGTVYTVAITTGVKDSSGNALTSNYTWSFTTGTITGVSFANIIQPIFNSYCTLCHIASGGYTGSGDASFLPLNSGVSYGNLVNVPATKSDGTRVIPGDSADSILYKRVSGTSAGAQMPKNQTPLSSTNQDYIKTWIDEGALNN